jgi:hypothetical protein
MGSFFKGIGREDHCIIKYNGICYRQISADDVLTEEAWNDSAATTGFDIENDCECECILTTTAAPTSPSPTTTTSGATTIEGTTTTSGGTTTTSGGTTTTSGGTTTTSGGTTTTSGGTTTTSGGTTTTSGGTTTTSGGTTTTGEPTTTTVCCPENSSTIISIEDFECEFIEFSDLEGSHAFITQGTIVRHDNVLYTFNNPYKPTLYNVDDILARSAWQIYSDSESFGQYSPAYNNEFSPCCNLATTTSTIAPTTTTASYCDQQAALQNPDEFRRSHDILAFGNWKYPPCE